MVPVKGLRLLCCGVNSPAAVERRVGNLICDPGEIRDLTDKGEERKRERRAKSSRCLKDKICGIVIENGETS